MDLVEALDTWIDDRIDDFTDDELENMLEILDVVSASELADLDTSLAYNDDVYTLVEQCGGSKAERSHVEDILRAAFFGDPLPADVVAEEQQEDLTQDRSDDDDAPTHATVEEADSDDAVADANDPDSGQEPGSPVALGGESALAEDGPDTDNQLDDPPEPDDELDCDDELEAQDELEVEHEPDRDDELDDPPEPDDDSELHSDFLSDIESAGSEPVGPAPVEFRAGDALGPSFLESSPDPVRTSRAWMRWAFAIFMLGGMAVFVYGSLQLFSTLNPPIETTAPTPTPPQLEPETAAAPATSETPATAPVDTASESTPASAPTPIPELAPAPRIAIRLVTGDVVLTDFEDIDSETNISLIYNASAGDFLPAQRVTWLGSRLGVIDAEGSLLAINPDASQPLPQLIYEPGDDLPPLREIAPVAGQIAVLTDNGDLALIANRRRATPANISYIWQPDDEDPAAVDIDSVGTLVPVVFDDGTVKIFDTANRNRTTTIWDPAEDEPSAFTVRSSATSVLIGIGQGGVAEYHLDDSSDTPTTIWRPVEDDETPALGYARAGDNVALVLGDGAILLVDPDDDRTRLWDPEETEISALAVDGDPAHATVLLETGFVVRIPLAGDEPIESVWDVTDETLPPATQLAVETLTDE